jgi:hypothetical protein
MRIVLKEINGKQVDSTLEEQTDSFYVTKYATMAVEGRSESRN